MNIVGKIKIAVVQGNENALQVARQGAVSVETDPGGFVVQLNRDSVIEPDDTQHAGTFGYIFKYVRSSHLQRKFSPFDRTAELQTKTESTEGHGH